MYLIKLAPVITPRKSVDKRFQRYVEQEKLFHGQIARDEKGLLDVCRHTLREAENLIRRAKGHATGPLKPSPRRTNRRAGQA